MGLDAIESHLDPLCNRNVLFLLCLAANLFEDWVQYGYLTNLIVNLRRKPKWKKEKLQIPKWCHITNI